MIKNIVFDIGNVLADFSWKEFLAKKGFSKEMIKRIAMASVATPDWDEFDRGVLTEDEAFERFLSHDPEIGEEIHKAFDNITGMIGRYDYAIPLVKGLKAVGYKVLYLSNFSKKAYDECRDAIDFLPYMDGGMMSWSEHILKPGSEIYLRLAEHYELIPEETVFLDDSSVNVEASVRLGWHGICFENIDQATDEMRKLGINI